MKNPLFVCALLFLLPSLACQEDLNHTWDPCRDVFCDPGDCEVQDGAAVCRCPVGYHPEGRTCAADEVDPCEDQDCSGHGACVVDEEGIAACDCDDGYEADGLACVWVDVFCGDGIVAAPEECDPPDGVTCDEYCRLIGAGPGPVGAPCHALDDCLGNWCITDDDGWPDGYCTHYQCDASDTAWETSCAPYGGDALCVDMGDYGLCLDRCDPAGADCRAGYECFDLGGGYGACFPEPVCGNGLVESGEECDPPDGGICGPDCQGTGDAPIGDPCLGAANCAGNWCITDEDGWPDGYCTHYQCDASDTAWETSCAPYGGDALCVDMGDYGLCMDRCDPAGADCRAGYECFDLGGGTGVCYPEPVCGNGFVEAGEECDPPDGGVTCTDDCQGTGDAPVGNACLDAADCAGNLCIADGDGWPDGYCSHYQCDASEAAWETSCAPYGGDALCLDMGDYGLCLDRCDTAASDCRAGYECYDLGGGYGACYPEPVCGNGFVEGGEECDPPDGGICGPDCQGTGTAPVGDPCLGAVDCAGNWCLSPEDGYPDGYCVFAGCDLLSLNSCAPYGPDAVCVNFGTVLEPYGVCMDGCSPGPGACRAGYSCDQLFPGVRICQP